jgi:hypothetical protein
MHLNTVAVAGVAVIAMFSLSGAIAQTAPPSTAAAPDPTQSDAPKKPMTRKESRAVQEKADARLCLEFPTQLMIIKCADKYRLNKRDTG